MFILQNDIYIAVGFELGIEEERQSLRVPALAATGLDFDRRADAVSASAAPAPTFSLTSTYMARLGIAPFVVSQLVTDAGAHE